MPITQPTVISAGPTPPTRGVMVGVIAGPHGPATGLSAHLPRWRRLTPGAVWTQLSLRDTSRAGLLHGLTAALDRYAMTQRQLIMLGEGAVARAALELVLQGAVGCGGIIASGISREAPPSRNLATRAAIRVVVHDADGRQTPDDLVGVLQAADIDARIIRLTARAANDTRIAASAIETFLMELVATVGHQVLGPGVST
jgi:hypothetical protein